MYMIVHIYIHMHIYCTCILYINIHAYCTHTHTHTHRYTYIILYIILDCNIQPVHPKGNQSWIFTGRSDAEAETLNTLATWWEELTHKKRPWCWETLKLGEQDTRGWDGWLASPTQWTCVWVNSRSWWLSGRLGVLQTMGFQRVRHDWRTELSICLC